MELKDVVLQTLNEIENSVNEKGFKDIRLGVSTGEAEFLHSFKERMFVLFEGLKQENLWIENGNDRNSQIQAKLDLILGFLQFQLALIDARLEVLDKRNFEIGQEI